jgi:hypothetical protein
MCVISFFPFFYFSFLFFSISILYYLYYYIKAARCSLPPPGSTSSQSAPSICPCSILALEAIPRWSAPPSLSTTPIALGRHPPFPSPPTVSPSLSTTPAPITVRLSHAPLRDLRRATAPIPQQPCYSAPSANLSRVA